MKKAAFSPARSRVEMTQVVLPGDTNPHGNVFGGRLMQWIDIAGAVAAHRHSRGNVVTASIDDLHFVEPIRLGDIVVLKSSVNWVGRTSMEVGVRILAERPGSIVQSHAASAYLTFVAIDRRGRPARVPALLAETADDRRRAAAALRRRQRRLELRREILKRHRREG
jgi:acyl-CoA hydrolase